MCIENVRMTALPTPATRQPASAHVTSFAIPISRPTLRFINNKVRIRPRPGFGNEFSYFHRKDANEQKVCE